MNKQEFISRRQALLEKMAPASAAVFFSAPPAQRNADSEYPYRQHSDFLYLTGFSEPEAVLVLIKSDETHNHSVLFNRVRDLTAEIWFGRRLGQDAAPEKLGIDRALPFDEINEQLCQLLNGLDTLYFAQGEMAYADTIVFNALDTLRRGIRRNLSAPGTIIDWRPIVHEMRLFKSLAELDIMRRAGKSVHWHTPARWKNAVRVCTNTSYRAKLNTNLSVTARVSRPITPLSAAVRTAAFCTTPKTNAG